MTEKTKLINLDSLLKSGDGKVKGYNNKIVDILIPKEVLEPQINILLSHTTPENLAKLLRINFSIKSYLIYIASNVESLIDTWVTIKARENIYFQTKIKNISMNDLVKWLCGSKNNARALLNGNTNKSIYQLIINGTLGMKLSILKCMSDENVSWFLSNKKGRKNMSNKEQFIDYLRTCLLLRNGVTHDSIFVTKQFWVGIFANSINLRVNATISELKTNDIVNQILSEISTLLNKADYNNIKNRMIKHIKHDLLKDGESWTEFKQGVEIDYILTNTK